MFENVLVPLDGSRLAELALPYAEEMAGKLGSEILLLTVAGSRRAREYHRRQIYLDNISAEIQRNTEKYLWENESWQLKIRTITRVGNPAEEIVTCAEEENISLVLMVTHGISGIMRWALGSVAEKVLRASKQPVALIRAENVRNIRISGMMKRLLVMLDGSMESETVLPYVDELAMRLGAETVLLQVVPEVHHVSADAEGYLERVCRELTRKGIKARCEIRVGSPAEEGIRLADEVDADMMAMATHGRSGISRWTLGSVAEKVLQGGNRPVLLVRAKDRDKVPL